MNRKTENIGTVIHVSANTAIEREVQELEYLLTNLQSRIIEIERKIALRKQALSLLSDADSNVHPAPQKGQVPITTPRVFPDRGQKKYRALLKVVSSNEGELTAGSVTGKIQKEIDKEVSSKWVSDTLHRLYRRGLLNRIDRGRYMLAVSGETLSIEGFES